MGQNWLFIKAEITQNLKWILLKFCKKMENLKLLFFCSSICTLCEWKSCQNFFFFFWCKFYKKLFFSVPNIMTQYTREFVPGKPFQPSLRYVVQPGARLIMLEQGKHSSLFCQCVRDGEKKLRKHFHLIANFLVQIWSITHWESDWERKRKELTEKVREEYWITCQMWNQLSKLRRQCCKTFFQVNQTLDL